MLADHPCEMLWWQIRTNDGIRGMTVRNALLTASKPELLDKEGDRTLRGLLYDFFAFSRNLEAARAKFASYVDLSPSQYLIMIAITHFRSDGPMGINQLAERLHLSSTFITNEVNKLVTAGLIGKEAHPSDGRRVQLAVTALGIGRLKRLAAFQRPVNDALFGMLTRDEFRSLSLLLARLAANGDRALRLAQHVEATLELDADRDGRTAAAKPAKARKRPKRLAAR